MLHILGMILKIAGILLGSILGMILLLSLLILFVSIRYRVNGSYGEKGPKDLDVKARISWLFSLIIVDIVYDDRGSSHKIRIFGIPIGRKRKTAVSKDTEEAHVIEKKDNTERTKDTKTVQDTKKEQAYIIEEEHKTEKEQESHKDQSTGKEQDAKDIQYTTYLPESAQEQEEESEGEQNRQRRVSFTQKLRQIWEKIKAVKNNIQDKIKNVKEKITQLHELLTDEKNKEALRLIGKQLCYLWKHIKPKKLSAVCRFGFDDPSLTGQALAAASVLYPYYKNSIQLYPNFEQKILIGEGYVKGRIRIFPMVLIIIRLWRNKQIRSMVKKWMRKNS